MVVVRKCSPGRSVRMHYVHMKLFKEQLGGGKYFCRSDSGIQGMSDTLSLSSLVKGTADMSTKCSEDYLLACLTALKICSRTDKSCVM